MKRRLWIVVMTVAVLALSLPATSALAADGGNGGRVVLGDDFVLEEGETVDGDLAVFGGSVTLERDSTVDGDLLVMGGNISAHGKIYGDAVVFGGNVDLGETAVVDGDLITLGGSVTGAEESVRGSISEGLTFPIVPRIRPPAAPPVWPRWSGGGSLLWSRFLGGLRAVMAALILGVLALVVVSLWPKQTELIAETVWLNPATSFGVGLLTYLVVAGLVVLLIITICLSPLLALITGVALLFGWMALGWLVGKRLLAALKAKSVAPVWEAGLGVFLITLLGAIPCLGWLVWVVGGALGLGAVVLTRLGTRRYNGGGATPQPALPPDESAMLEDFEGPDSVPDDIGLPGDDEALEEATVAVSESEPTEGDLMVLENANTVRDPDSSDDLQLIDGIGPVFAARLRENGITTFAQLAAAEPEELAAIVELFPERVVEDDWVGQAEKML